MKMPTNVIESANHRQQDASHEHRDNVLKQTSQGISRGHKKKTPWFRVFANAAVKNSHQIMAKAKLMPSSALWTEGNAQRWWHYSAYTLWQPSQASVIECVWGWGNTNAREDQLDSLCLHMHNDAVPGHSTIDFQHICSILYILSIHCYTVNPEPWLLQQRSHTSFFGLRPFLHPLWSGKPRPREH